MKQLRKIVYLFTLAVLLAACKGEDGEIGPAGETGAAGAKGDTGAAGAPGANGEGFEKVGFFQGTVAGKRTDGTAFSEEFKYEYGNKILGFYDRSGSKFIDLIRLGQVGLDDDSFNAPSLTMYLLKLEGNTLTIDPANTEIEFDFLKELNATDLFVLRAEPYFKFSAAYVLVISDQKNSEYNFGYSSSGKISYQTTSYFDGNSSIPVYQFYFYYLNKYYNAYYRQSDGTLLGIFENGQLITSGSVFNIYNKLVFKNNPALGEPTFYEKATNTSVHTSVPDVPADQLTITNYVQDATTGNLSFNFVLTISKYRKRTDSSSGMNTTGNDLTITGTFNSGAKVYKNMVSRKSSGE